MIFRAFIYKDVKIGKIVASYFNIFCLFGIFRILGMLI